MPHLVILYTPNLEAETDMNAACRALADAMLTVHDEQGAQVFPTAGVRVLACPAAHAAVADGARDYGFIYLNLRMGRGRSREVHQRTGAVLTAAARTQFAPLLERRYVGITLQIDEGQEVFDAKFGNIHPLFRKN